MNGVKVERKDNTVTITGLAYAARLIADFDKSAYRVEWADGASPATGTNQAWDERTTLRYALLAYRNGINARLAEAIWPREARVRAQRGSLLKELAEQQAQQQALLLALARKLGAVEPGK
jgi:hypothetical protein